MDFKEGEKFNNHRWMWLWFHYPSYSRGRSFWTCPSSLRSPSFHGQKFCKSGKLNVTMVFKYYTKKFVPFAGVECSYHMNSFWLCILVSFTLVHETPWVDPVILHVVKNLGVEVLCLLSWLRLSMAWMQFIGRKQLSLRVVLSFFKYWSLIFAQVL